MEDGGEIKGERGERERRKERRRESKEAMTMIMKAPWERERRGEEGRG